LLGRHHPFSTQIFKSDGRTILTEITKETGDKALLDILSDQFVFETVIGSYLYAGLDFNELKEPTRWWPIGKDRSVVIELRRAFGVSGFRIRLAVGDRTNSELRPDTRNLKPSSPRHSSLVPRPFFTGGNRENRVFSNISPLPLFTPVQMNSSSLLARHPALVTLPFTAPAARPGQDRI
jgi:hypothetical protein